MLKKIEEVNPLKFEFKVLETNEDFFTFSKGGKCIG